MTIPIGVNADAAERDLALAAGALQHGGYVRTGLQMNIVTANGTPLSPGRYAFDGKGAGANGYSYDAAFTRMCRHGLTWLPVIINKQSMNGPFAPPRTPDELRRFQLFCEAACGRYGRRGTFWNDHPDVPYMPVTAWEVLNEENHRAYWQDTPSGTAYAQVLAAARAGLLDADDTATVVLGGLVWAGNEYTTRNYMGTDRFIREVVEANGQAAFDAVAVHPYVSNHDRSARAVARAAFSRVEYIAGSLAHYCPTYEPEVWITEFGWVSADDHYLATSETTQAAQLAAFLVMVAAHRSEYRIGPALWFSLRDQGSSRLGLAYGDYRPKQAWTMLRQLAAGVPDPQEPTPGAGAIASAGVGSHASAVELLDRLDHTMDDFTPDPEDDTR